MREEIRTHLLEDSENGNQKQKQKELNINGGWEQQELAGYEKCPSLDASSSPSITLTLLLTAFIAALGSLSSGFAVGYTSPVQAELMQELGLSTAEYSLFGSMLNIGATVSALLCGKITDYLGRRRAIQLADASYILGWLAIAVAQGPWFLDFGRWMLGFSMTITSYSVPIYIAEFTPKNFRGGFVLLHLFMLIIGSSTVYLMGLVTSWRTLALIGIIPCSVQLVGLFFVSESPRWLMMIGRDEEFRAALQRIRGAHTNISQEIADMKDGVDALQQMSKVSIIQFFQRKYAYVLTVGIGLSALVPLLGMNGILFYARSIFESAGVSGTLGTVAMAVIQLPSVTLGVMLADSCGRRPLLMISAAGLCFGCLLAGFSFLLQDHHVLQGMSPYFALVGLMVYMAAYPIGVGGGSTVIISEIYPINVKGLAGSLTSMVQCVFGWIVSYVFNFLMEWSSSGTFFILAGTCASTLVFIAKLVPETGGRTLEEVHKSLSHVWQ